MRTLWRDRRGGAGILIAAALPMLIGAGAVAVDLGSIQLETRRLQGIADAAALAAATDPDHAQARAQAVFGDSSWPRAATVHATPGKYRSDPTLSPSLRFAGTATSPDAARVTIESQSPTFLARIFGQRTVTISRTATAARQRFAAFSIPGLAGLASIKVPLFLELASAEGKVSAIACPSLANRSVTIDARTSPGQAALGNIDTSRLQDFSSPITASTANLVHTLLLDVTGSAHVDLGAAEPWQPLRFDQGAITAKTPQTVRSTTPVAGIATSLLQHPSLGARLPLLGISIPIDTLLRGAVGGALSTVAPALDDLLGLVTGAVGVGIGEADVRVTGIRCGQPVLVA